MEERHVTSSFDRRAHGFFRMTGSGLRVTEKSDDTLAIGFVQMRARVLQKFARSLKKLRKITRGRRRVRVIEQVVLISQIADDNRRFVKLRRGC